MQIDLEGLNPAQHQVGYDNSGPVGSCRSWLG